MSEKSEYSVRTATADDLPEMVRIEAAVHVAPWSREAFQAELDKPYSHTLVMTDEETDSVIAGYIVYWLMFDECQILNVVTDLPFRSQGFARQMIRKVVDQALRQNLKRVVLNVRKSNSAAIQLYQRVGFTIGHVRKRFYSNGEDAYELVIDLTTGQVLDF